MFLEVGEGYFLLGPVRSFSDRSERGEDWKHRGAEILEEVAAKHPEASGFELATTQFKWQGCRRCAYGLQA